jgi:hypothetical protein
MRLSVVVVAYNMARELPRTVLSLSPAMQQGIDSDDYEVIVVDNGSDPPAAVDEAWGGARLMRIDDGQPSPASAINRALQVAEGDLVGVMIDGARLASPGLLAGALRASSLHRRPVISSLGFHLGPEVQMTSVAAGYDAHEEDRLLAGSGWESDGYRLFEISVFAGSSAHGWFAPIAESNALFMAPALWDELGGYDERFVSPGGGLVNLDTYARACALPDSQLVLLLGEGTFHQVHGGVATNAPSHDRQAFRDEYELVRGFEYQVPQVEPLYVGQVAEPVLGHIGQSAELARKYRKQSR